MPLDKPCKHCMSLWKKGQIPEELGHGGMVGGEIIHVYHNGLKQHGNPNPNERCYGEFGKL